MPFGKSGPSPIAELLNQTSMRLEGPSASTRGTAYEKYLAPPLAFHAAEHGLSETPALVALVWILELTSPDQQITAPVKKPRVALLAAWDNGVTLLSYEQKRRTHVQGLLTPPTVLRTAEFTVKEFLGNKRTPAVVLTHADLGAPAWLVGFVDRVSGAGREFVANATPYRDHLISLYQAPAASI
jgi:hypothetical protein